MNPTAADSDTSGRAPPSQQGGKGKEARMKPKEMNVAETSAKRTATVTDRGALETNADGGFPATTTGTPTSAEIGIRERRGCTTAAGTHPSSSSALPCNGNPPSGSGCCWPCHSGWYNHPWHQLPSYLPVFVGHPPSVHTTLIDRSRHETTYESYSNHGQHVTSHGFSTTHIHPNTYPSPQVHGVYFEAMSRVVSSLA